MLNGPEMMPAEGFHYWYRVHCGGPAYTDTRGDTWMADRALAGGSTWGSSSWTTTTRGCPPFLPASAGISDPIKGTRDWPLFQTFRYGRDKLSYTFPMPDGNYRVELYFMEPWIGERVFDVAVNGHTVLKDLNIAKEVGMHAALKKVVTAHITGGRLVISFPRVTVGQAVISAIAIASTTPVGQVAPSKSVFSAISGVQFLVHRRLAGWRRQGIQ
jgi:beta-galactosidase